MITITDVTLFSSLIINSASSMPIQTLTYKNFFVNELSKDFFIYPFKVGISKTIGS